MPMSAKDITTPGGATAGGESDVLGAGAGAIVDSMAGGSVATAGYVVPNHGSDHCFGAETMFIWFTLI